MSCQHRGGERQERGCGVCEHRRAFLKLPSPPPQNSVFLVGLIPGNPPGIKLPIRVVLWRPAGESPRGRERGKGVPDVWLLLKSKTLPVVRGTGISGSA